MKLTSHALEALLLVVLIAIVATTAEAQTGTNQSTPPGTTPPTVVKSTEPKFSEEALEAEYDGTVVLWGIVGLDGTLTDVKVQRSLGCGLDDEAMAAAKQWQFKAGQKDGKPIPMPVNLVVRFVLPHRTKFKKLMSESEAGDPLAQLRLSTAFYMGIGVSQDPKQGTYWLTKAADQGQKYALCGLGDKAFNERDLVAAYVWYSLARESGCERSTSKLSRLAHEMSSEQMEQGKVRMDTWKLGHPMH